MKMIITILLFAVLDITLTHYLFFLDRKKDVLDMSCEKNWIPRLIMQGNPNPINFITAVIINVSVMGFILMFAGELMTGIIFGLLIFVNYSHYHQLMDRRRNWDNELYWKIVKLEREVRK